MMTDQPHALFDWYRELQLGDPVTWDAKADEWIVVGYRNIIDLLHEPSLVHPFALPRELPPGVTPAPELAQFFDRWQRLHVDGSHLRFRARLTKSFTAHSARIAEETGVEARRLLSAAVASMTEGRRCDLVADVADPLASFFVVRALGLDPDRAQPVVARFAGARALLETRYLDAEGVAAGRDLVIELGNFFVGELDRLGAGGGDDAGVLGLIAQDVQSGRVDIDDAVAYLIALLRIQGGTRELFANGLRAMTIPGNPSSTLARDPSSSRWVASETIRLESPVQAVFRIASKPITLDGVYIETDQPVRLLFGAGNRSPEAFPEPDLALSGRDGSPDSLTFGHGPRRCPAVGIVSAAFESMLLSTARYAEQLAPRSSEIQWAAEGFEHHVTHLPVATEEP